jgi:hypothetical protein
MLIEVVSSGGQCLFPRQVSCTGSPRNKSLLSWYKLGPARQGAIPWQAGASWYLLVEGQLLGKLVQAFTSLLRSYSSASRYKLLPAWQGITPCQAGTSLYQPGQELFLGKQVEAGTCLPSNDALASWHKLLPAPQWQQRCPLVNHAWVWF